MVLFGTHIRIANFQYNLCIKTCYFSIFRNKNQNTVMNNLSICL
jgi:hypothetical protein